MTDDTISQHHAPHSLTGTTFPTSTTLKTMFAEVHTKRLLLRRPQVEDVAVMFKIHGDPATNLYNPTGADPDIAASAETLRQWSQHWDQWGFGYWAVTLASSAEVIGFGGVMHLIWRDRDVFNLYYRFTPSAWGQGYATEMAQKAVNLAQTALPAWPVVARTRAANHASQRTAERSGLVRHADLDTHHLAFTLGWGPINDTTV